MEWIKLSDKKPEIGQKVITWGDQGMRFCVYTNRLGFLGLPKKDAKFCNLMSKWLFIDESVTHWIPLPPPPD